MTTSQLITALESAMLKHGDLPIRFQVEGLEQRFQQIIFAPKGNASHHGAVRGAPQFEPDRLIVKCSQ